jgi:hypothetical protein
VNETDPANLVEFEIEPSNVVEAEDELPRARSLQAKTPYDAAHPKALAVYCSDGRFTEAVEELLSELGHARIDTLTIPGGAALLHVWSADLSAAETVRKSASFLIEGHRLEEVVLIAHAGCGYYRARFSSLPPDQVILRQIMDLGRATAWLRQHHPRVRVCSFFARPEDGRILFDRKEGG